MTRFFERAVRGHMVRRGIEGLEDLAEAMRREGSRPCPFDASYVERTFRAGERTGPDGSYFACLRGALGLTEGETLDLVRAFYFGEGPYPL